MPLPGLVRRRDDPSLGGVVLTEARAVRETHPAGVDVVRQGDAGDDFFVLVRGTVEILRDGRPVMAFSQSGTFLGEIASILKVPRTATVRTLEECEFLRFPQPVEVALRGEPKILHRLLVGLEKRVRHLEELLAQYQTPTFHRMADRLAYLAMTHGGRDLGGGRAKMDREGLRERVRAALEKNEGVPDPDLLIPLAKAAGIAAQFQAALREEFGGFRPFGRRPPVESLDPVRSMSVETGVSDLQALARRIAEGNEILSRYLSDPTHERNREAAAADLENVFEPASRRSILLGVFFRFGLKGGSLADMRIERLRFEGEIDRAEDEAVRRRSSDVSGPSPFLEIATRYGFGDRYIESLRTAVGG